MLAKSSKNSSKRVSFLVKSYLKRSLQTSRVQRFFLLFRKNFFKENFSVVASVILHRFDFSNTTKWLSVSIKKT